jgi:hypothetical protein
MKLTFNIVSAFLIFALSIQVDSNQAEKNSVAVAKLIFETDTIDYGTIEQNSDGKRVFNFTNEGDAPLVITNVRPSCGCTVANYTKEPIQPGASGQIEVGYDTKRLGAFNKSITVTSNAEESRKILRIKGVVVAKEDNK